MSKYSDKELTTFVETVPLADYLNMLRKTKFEKKIKK
jgi:hypothetical protein